MDVFVLSREAPGTIALRDDAALLANDPLLEAFSDRDVQDWDFGGRPDTKPVLR